MTSPFNTRGSPFDIGHQFYHRVTNMTQSPLNGIEIRMSIKRLIQYSESLNERIIALESALAGRPVASPVSDGVLAAEQTTLLPADNKRGPGKASGKLVRDSESAPAGV